MDIMACEEGMSAAATECVMCGEGERERETSTKHEDGFVVRKLWHPTDPTRERPNDS